MQFYNCTSESMGYLMSEFKTGRILDFQRQFKIFFFETCFPLSSDFSMCAVAQGICYSSRSNPCPSVGVHETWLVLNLLHEHKTLAGLWQLWADHTQLQCIYSSHGMGTVCVTGGGLTQPAMTFRVQQALLTHQSFICNTVQFCMAIERFKMVTSSMLI